MNEMTMAEVARELRRLDQHHRELVSKEVHETIIEGLRDDIEKLEQTVNKMVWAVIALFVGIVSQIIVAIASRGFG